MRSRYTNELYTIQPENLVRNYLNSPVAPAS